MQDWMQHLLILQDKDLRIAKIEAQSRAVPEEKKKATDEIAAEEAAVAAAKDNVRTAEKAIKSMEIEVETVRTRMQDFLSKSAMIKNNEEYRAALHQVDTCRQQISEFEDRELQAMEDLDRAKRVFDAENKKLAAARQRITAVLTDLDTRLANCEQELLKMRQERDGLAAAVPADALRRYDRIRMTRLNNDARAFVPIRNGACDGCHMNVTAQVRVNANKAQTSSCPNCGRLLYVEE